MAERKPIARRAVRRTSRIAGACAPAAGFAVASHAPPAEPSPPTGPRVYATEPAPPTGSPAAPELVTSGSGVGSFVSEPGLHPVRVTVTTS